MALVEAGVAGADFEAGLAAAHAEVGRLEALLVAAKVRVIWYHRAIRRHARMELDAKHAPKKEETDVDKNDSSSSKEEGEGEVVAEVFAPSNAAEDAETEGEDKRSGALVEAERAEDAGPTRLRKTKLIACPADQCKACWNTNRGGWPGVKHSRELRSCRLNKAEGVSHKRPRLVQRK